MLSSSLLPASAVYHSIVTHTQFSIRGSSFPFLGSDIKLLRLTMSNTFQITYKDVGLLDLVSAAMYARTEGII